MEEQLLTSTDMQWLSEQASELMHPEANTQFLSSLGSIKTRLLKDISIITKIMSAKGNIDPTIESQLMVQLFKDVVALRTFFTGQQYMLAINYYNSTYQAPLDDLFPAERIIINNGRIEYHVKDIIKTFEKINNYNDGLKELNKKVFTKTISNRYGNFIYVHGNGDKNGPDNSGFWQEHFAAYRAKGVQHYFIENRQKRSIVYNAASAKYYNRGHVYEKYLSDINSKKLDSYHPDPYIFMKELTKDNVSFLRGGDYKMNKDGIIYAVQVKKINNKKLISYTQLYNILKSLEVLTQKGISKTTFKQVIKKAFITGEKNINRGASSYIDHTVDQLFKDWG